MPGQSQEGKPQPGGSSLTILMTNHPLTPVIDKSTSSAVLELIPQLLPGLIPESMIAFRSHPSCARVELQSLPVLVSIPLS